MLRPTYFSSPTTHAPREAKERPRSLARGLLLSLLVLGLPAAGCDDDSASTSTTTGVFTGNTTGDTGSASGATGAGPGGSTTGSTDTTGTTGAVTTGTTGASTATGTTGLPNGSTGTTAGTGGEGTTGGMSTTTGSTTGGMPVDGGMPLDGGSGGEGSATTGEPEPREDLGEGTGEDVITIGDSWMSLISSGIQQSLVDVSGQPYRTYGVPGTRMLNEQIPDQYADAKNENPDIKTVVMTGGGNDIIQVPGLRESCDAMEMTCTVEVTKILDRISALWEEMAADGVQDVLYVMYSEPDGTDVDFIIPTGDTVVKRCEMVPPPLRCHTLATSDIVMGDIPDGIHPSAAGYDRVGEAVYQMMVDRGMRR